ncbi:PIN domain-like protein [Suillus fuscotomentosus]|uniref:PIN domain-like protein n=1 Tax=Suillus fuscotomentosus TaxID=1912939 RepID=A0AAD4DSZ6_9AGAM|nr:PIN domain-like protein [Suillus fuscotomentosus]KAG1893197.1 PIN domain-like protein [Suillus fuscotomentosus]
MADLWKLLSPVAERETLTKFALEEFKGHVQDKDGLSIMVIGVDAGSWLHTVCTPQYLPFMQSSENPELRRTLMYALVALASAPLHAHFVFGGADRPPIWTAPPWIVGCLQELLQIFGFTWSMADNEAERELASLSKANKICAVLTEDSKTFTFGAKRVIRPAVKSGSEIRVDVYLNPTTPSSDGDEPCGPCFTSTQPNLVHLASFCKSRLGWESEKIHGYLRRRVWQVIFLRAFCQFPANGLCGPPPKPSFCINRQLEIDGGVSAYNLTIFAPSFVTAINQGLQAGCSDICGFSSVHDASQAPDHAAWFQADGGFNVPTRVLKRTAPEQVLDFLDHETPPSHVQSQSRSISPTDWHPRLSAQYAQVSELLWPKDAASAEGSRTSHMNL